MNRKNFSRWGKFALAGIAATGAFALAACSGGAAGAGGGADATDEKPLKVALITHQAPGDTFFDIMRSGADAAGQKNNIEVLYSSDPDGSRQAQLVEQAIDQNVDGIVLTLAKPDAMAGAVKEATEAGIPVVSVNGGETESKKLGALTHFGQDDYLAGKALGEQLNERGSKRAICVIMEQGHIGLENRCKGLGEVFEGQSEILYVNGQDMTNVQSTITSKLQTNPDIDYVVTLGAPFAMTGLKAIKDAGSDAQLGTVDLNKDVFGELQKGTIQFSIDQQPWLQGYSGIEAIRLYTEGGYILGGGQPVLTGPTVITSDNLDSVAPQFEGGDDEAAEDGGEE